MYLSFTRLMPLSSYCLKYNKQLLFLIFEFGQCICSDKFREFSLKLILLQGQSFLFICLTGFSLKIWKEEI